MNDEAMIITALLAGFVSMITACGVLLKQFKTSDCKTPLGEIHLEKSNVTEV
jgi:hypothetical protein